MMGDSERRERGTSIDDRERFRALAEAVAADEEMERLAAQRPPAPKRAHPALKFLFAVALPLAAWGQFGSPPWLDHPHPRLSPIEEEAFLRISLYVQAQRIERFLAASGSLPPTLLDAGDVVPGIEYTRMRDNNYRLAGRTGSVDVRYESTEPLSTVLQTSGDPAGGDELAHPAEG
jgi:hypothetical protein